MTVEPLFQTPVFYHPGLARVLGDITAAVFLTSAGRLQVEVGEQSWWTKTADEWAGELGISSRVVERIRQRLEEDGFLVRRRVRWGNQWQVQLKPLAEALVSCAQDSPVAKVIAFDPALDHVPEPAPPPPILPKEIADSLPAKKRYRPEEEELPVSLRTEEFSRVWKDWCKDRRAQGKPLTPLSVQRQFKTLEDVVRRRGIAVAIRSVEQSIERGYQGIFEPKVQAPSGRPEPPQPSPQSVAVSAFSNARRRLLEAAFEAQQRGLLSEESLSPLVARIKAATTIAELNRVGNKVPGWDNE